MEKTIKKNVYMCVAGSLFHTAEINTTLQIKKKKSLIKKKKKPTTTDVCEESQNQVFTLLKLRLHVYTVADF